MGGSYRKAGRKKKIYLIYMDHPIFVRALGTEHWVINTEFALAIRAWYDYNILRCQRTSILQGKPYRTYNMYKAKFCIFFFFIKSTRITLCRICIVPKMWPLTLGRVTYVLYVTEISLKVHNRLVFFKFFFSVYMKVL